MITPLLPTWLSSLRSPGPCITAPPSVPLLPAPDSLTFSVGRGQPYDGNSKVRAHLLKLTPLLPMAGTRCSEGALVSKPALTMLASATVSE